MTPRLVVRKSALCVLNFWLILFFWLIIPLIIQIARIIIVKHEVIEFYDTKMIVRKGVFNKHESQSVFAGVYSVKVYQSFWGRIFNFGDLVVDCPGEWDISTTGVKNPRQAKSYLETKITAKGMTNIIHN